MRGAVGLALAFFLDAGSVGAQPSVVEPDGTVLLPPIALPPSEFVGPESRMGAVPVDSMVGEMPEDALNTPGPFVDEFRRQFDEATRAKADWLRERFPVDIQGAVIGGVPVEIFTPRAGVAEGNANRILVNLHGGGFFAGAVHGGRVESIRLSHELGIRIVSIDYRLGPEHKFPAASEDVAAVYRELLKTYQAGAIGLYGCSAGGYLTAQALAWFQKEKLPRPGAAGILCASAFGFSGGDSAFLWPLGRRPTRDRPTLPVPYLLEADLKDPLVSPGRSPDVLAKFPPTIIMTSTRASDLSPAVATDLLLSKIGIESELHVWEGLAHAAYFWGVELPDAADANLLLARFFDRHLER